MKHIGHPYFPYYEHHYLSFIKRCLTVNWPLIQGGYDENALFQWQAIFVILEFDKKAIADIMLLAHSGEAGRAEANELLWYLLSDVALRYDYRDMSHLVSRLAMRSRRNIDRPPGDHLDRETWYWEKYWVPRDSRWAPSSVPPGATCNLHGAIQEPPYCWG